MPDLEDQIPITAECGHVFVFTEPPVVGNIYECSECGESLEYTIDSELEFPVEDDYDDLDDDDDIDY